MKNFLTFILVLLNGCAVIKPDSDFTTLAAEQTRGLSSWQADTTEQNLGLKQLIDYPELSELIDEALHANPSLQQTLLTVQVSQAQWRQVSGEQYPDVAFTLSGVKEENATASYTGALTINWQVDLWRTLSDRAYAAAKDAEQQQWLYQAAKDTLAAEVMTSWLGLIAQQQMIAIQHKRVKALANSEQFILQRFRNGLGSLDDLDSARSSLFSARASLEAYQQSLAQQQRSLRSLLGRTEDAPMVIAQNYPPVIEALADLPSQTLARRPDLQAAYTAIDAASRRSRAAYNDLLPTIDLQAALQDVAANPRDALLTDPLWSLLGQLTAPLYQGGQLRAAADITELQTAQSFQSYRQVLLTAVTEVEDALGQEQSLARQQLHITNSLASARNVLQQYRSSYRSGLVNIIDLLTVEQRTYDLESQLNDLLYQRYSNRVSLGLALGLGVDNAGEQT